MIRAPLVALCLLSLLPRTASATWSLIVLDRQTGFVGVAGASCTSDVHGIMALFPGRGALVAQAISHPSAMREGIRLLRDGVTPDSVLRALSATQLDSALHDRQYAIATFTGGQVQFTGDALRDHRGERSAPDILVQGSLLAGPAVLEKALEAVQQARAAGRSMEEVLMAGLKAGSDAGGDSRCGAQRATAAFLAVAKPDDNPNWPFLTLRVVDAARGSAVNAVELLDARLALWQRNGGRALRLTSETVKPDSTR